MNRIILPYVQQDLSKKIVLLSGPRQVGKTTLSKDVSKSTYYLNYDSTKDRKILKQEEWDRTADVVIFDEIHKMRNWKSWIKGIYDTDGIKPQLLITGSARLDVYRKGGDSLAGRFHHWRLHPFTVKELTKQIKSKEALERILLLGGFPEPFLSHSDQEAARWRRSHFDTILRHDLLDLERVREIKSIEILVSLLQERVGGTISFSSLAEDLSVSPHTIKHWLQILENLYIIFRVTPYSTQIPRAIRKEPKFYFYDTGAVEGDMGARLENTVACALRAELDFLEDSKGLKTELSFIRDKEKNEVDFLISINRKPKVLLEVKTTDDQFSSSLFKFYRRLSRFYSIDAFQIVKDLRAKKSKEGMQMLAVHDFLENINL